MPTGFLYEQVAHAIQKINRIGDDSLNENELTYMEAVVGSVNGNIDLDAIIFSEDSSTADDMLVDYEEAAELGYAKSSADGFTSGLMRLIQPDDAAELAGFDPEELMDCEFLF